MDIGQVLFLRVYDKVEVHKHAKKRMRPISSHRDRASLVNKGLLYGKFHL